eukprot:36312-Eustigmatos_ZCMA.PRE.1
MVRGLIKEASAEALTDEMHIPLLTHTHSMFARGTYFDSRASEPSSNAVARIPTVSAICVSACANRDIHTTGGQVNSGVYKRQVL